MHRLDRLKMMLNKFHFGDCLSVMHDIPTASVDLILADLPYGTTQCDWDIVIPFSDLWKCYNRVIKENGAIVLFGAEPFSSYLRMSNISNFRYDWVWDKIKGTGFLNAKIQPMRNHEIISVFYRKQPVFNPQKTYNHPRKISFRAKHLQTEVYGEMKNDYKYDSTERYPRSIQIFSTDTQNNSEHSTQKPVALCEFLIKTYSNEGGIVLDNCAGSGTTGVACMNTSRGFILIENNKLIYNLGVRRLEKHRQENIIISANYTEVVGRKIKL